MNIYTQDIMSFLKVDVEVAEKIQYMMECEDFDFSEATKKQFERQAKAAYDEIIYS